MTERLGYRHVADLLAETTSGELTGWLAYLQVDDEVKTQRTAYAIAKAFNGSKKTAPAREEVIDTTQPEFVEKFKGFTHTKPANSSRRQEMSTEIKLG